MIELDITANAEPFRRQFGALAEKQIPYALARSLTQSAADAREQIKAQFPKVFHMRNRRTLTSVITERADKKTPIAAMQAMVGIRDLWIAQHDIGREKTPQRGPSLFIPAGRGAAQGALNRGTSGATKTAFKPSALIGGALQGIREAMNRPASTHFGKIKKRKPTRKLPAAFIQTVQGNKALFQRLTKGRYPVRMVYLLEPRADIQSDRIQSRQITELIVRQRWPIYFSEFLDDAIKTAK